MTTTMTTNFSHYMSTLAAFLNGVREFRLDATTHYDDDRLLESYDLGRDFAHRLTFRYYDDKEA